MKDFLFWELFVGVLVHPLTGWVLQSSGNFRIPQYITKKFLRILLPKCFMVICFSPRVFLVFSVCRQAAMVSLPWSCRSPGRTNGEPWGQLDALTDIVVSLLSWWCLYWFFNGLNHVYIFCSIHGMMGLTIRMQRTACKGPKRQNIFIMEHVVPLVCVSCHYNMPFQYVSVSRQNTKLASAGGTTSREIEQFSGTKRILCATSWSCPAFLFVWNQKTVAFEKYHGISKIWINQAFFWQKASHFKLSLHSTTVKMISFLLY